VWVPYHDPRACWGFAAGLRQRIAPRAYGPAIRLVAARSGYHARRASHNLPTLDPLSSHFRPTMSQSGRRHVTDRLPIGSDRVGIDWPRGWRAVRPTAAATPLRPDPGTQSAPRRPGRGPNAGTTCKDGPASSARPGSGAPKLPQPDRPGAGPSLPGPLCGQPAERRKRAFPEPLRYPFRGTPEGIDDFVTSLLWPHVIGNPLKPFVTLWRQGL